MADFFDTRPIVISWQHDQLGKNPDLRFNVYLADLKNNTEEKIRGLMTNPPLVQEFKKKGRYKVYVEAVDIAIDLVSERGGSTEFIWGPPLNAPTSVKVGQPDLFTKDKKPKK